MLRKTLISLAVASSVGLTGCLDDGSSDKNANPDYQISNPDRDGKTWPIFNPITSELPIPNDLIFDSDQGDGTFGVSDSSPPVTTALNELSGASTVAPAVIQLNGRVDPATVNAGTVFLLQLEYASGDPVQGLSNGEPPTVAGAANVRADVETLDGTSAIRILPLEPLEPRKRYVAVVTKDVKDLNGDSILASPSYENLTDESQPLGNAGLAAVRTLINSLWEPSIEGALGITDDQIALSYSFTTSNDEKVLQYIAEPASWFSDQLATFVTVNTAQSAVAGGANSYDAVQPVVETAYDNFPNIPIDDEGTLATEALAAIYGPSGPCDPSVLTGKAAFDCGGVALATSFSAFLPVQGDRGADDFDFSSGNINAAPLVSAVTGPILGALGAASDDVVVAQGTVSLPYYLSSSPEGIVADSWVADSGFAAGLNDQFADIGLEIPQADSSTSTAVNYIFPFPEKQSDEEVPVLVIMPNPGGTNGLSDNGKTVIYQHGITTDRSAALTFGTALAANGYTVVAIDQPLHGVAAFTADEQEALAEQLLTATGATEEQVATLTPLVLAENVNNLATALGGGTATAETTAQATSLINTTSNAGSTIPGLKPMEDNERHFGFYAAQPSTPAAIDYDNGVGDSGSLFINLTSFLTTRDNLRQSAVDQMNLRASLSEDVTVAPGLTVPSGDIYFVGHSLGTITGTPFIAAVNANQTAPVNTSVGNNDITSASMLTPGGGIVRLLENSPTFAPQILFGLQQSAGLEQGDADLESYLNVFQATVDTADPINFVDNLSDQGTGVLFSEVQGDTVIPNAADESLWGIAPLSGTFTPAQTGLPVNVTVDSFNAPLAGTDPLSLGLSAGVDDPLFSIYTQADYPAATGEDPLSHSTPVSAQPSAAFTNMVLETIATF